MVYLIDVENLWKEGDVNLTLTKENLLRHSRGTRALSFSETSWQNTKARISLVCSGPGGFDSVGQRSENKVRVKENRFD